MTALLILAALFVVALVLLMSADIQHGQQMRQRALDDQQPPPTVDVFPLTSVPPTLRLADDGELLEDARP